MEEVRVIFAMKRGADSIVYVSLRRA
jgi:hypothetical protein